MFSNNQHTARVRAFGYSADGTSLVCRFFLYENRQFMGRFLRLGRKTLLSEVFRVPADTHSSEILEIGKSRFLP